MPQMIALPDGQFVRSDVVLAIRCGDAVAGDGYSYPPRVIIDYGTEESRFNNVIVHCESNEERDALAARIAQQINSNA